MTALSPKNAANSETNMLFENTGSVLDITQNFRECFPEIIGHSPALQTVLETVTKIAKSDGSVLIFGESGTGKELIAAAIHRLSNRSNKRFVPINCSAIPEDLLESELFGHEKGAFTGATSRRPGLFEVADGGTLFLDEIGDMPQRLQAKLLRVLQEKQFTSVGGNQLKSADVRIVAATNVELAEAVRNNRFRLDLFYRLNVLPVTLPPLRERREDIPFLLDYFLAHSQRLISHRTQCFFSLEAFSVLRNYDWPGNIRELQNLVERLVVTSSGGEITVSNLPAEYRVSGESYSLTSAFRDNTAKDIYTPHRANILTLESNTNKTTTIPAKFSQLPEHGIDLGQFMTNLEYSLIDQALARTENNKNQAAKLLGLNRTTLVERLKKRKLHTPNA